MTIIPSRIEDFPLLAVIPGGAYQAGSYGIVEAQLVMTYWDEDKMPEEVRMGLVREAMRSAQWALQHNHLNYDTDWIVAASEEFPGVDFRLELMSWDRVAAYQAATRH